MSRDFRHFLESVREGPGFGETAGQSVVHVLSLLSLRPLQVSPGL
jgi:hypothetical protein